jgi:hypothetical protein
MSRQASHRLKPGLPDGISGLFSQYSQGGTTTNVGLLDGVVTPSMAAWVRAVQGSGNLTAGPADVVSGVAGQASAGGVPVMPGRRYAGVPG